VRAPSNIAIIKYMGKSDSSLNLPENGSVSLTLNQLCTFMELRETDAIKSVFVPELPADARTELELLLPELANGGKEKIYSHLARVTQACEEIFPRYHLRVRKVSAVEIRSANTFPAASGIASSASSFAALTLASAVLRSESTEDFRVRFESDENLRAELAQISRQGSGSSCRSLEGPWVVWEADRVRRIVGARLPKFAHFVILISKNVKTVSSSEAHARVKTSPLWSGRTERVARRLKLVENAILTGDIRAIAQTAWIEAWEMHSLFHTAAEPFSYFQPGTIEALHFLAHYLKSDTPPIVTLDAGPNVHVLVPETARATWEQILREQFAGVSILTDGEGLGASILRVSGS
jgi:diphosphomevalonate decarboxylase